MSKAWETQRERSSARWLRLGVWIALHAGRGVGRLLLWPVVVYFELTGGDYSRASRRFLRHALGREPTWLERVRHWYTYAAVTLDRVFLLGDRGRPFSIDMEGHEEIDAVVRQGRGALLLVAHFGSFEVMRVMGHRQRALPIRILIDRQHGAILTDLLEALDPELAAGAIDASQRGPALVLTLKAALDRGHLLGMMADRARQNERTIAVSFMGRPARLPEGPWVLANALQVPVILVFGVYEGGDRYRIRFERFAPNVGAPRADRAAAMREQAQAYADRLSAEVSAAPYNWFNFFDFWTDETPED